MHSSNATQLIHLIKTGQISAEEVMRAHLKQIEKINPKINALTVRFDPETSLEEARKIDRLIAQNKPVGKLAGLPIAIKDALKVKGLVCCSGSPGFAKEGKAAEDATLVARLKREGAIVIGLTNVPEMCRGGDSDNLMYGQTNNPYDLTKTPGGSSGGSAALVAAEGVPFSIGSDGGGSVVQPCHCTGIAGLKPTHGLLPPTGSVGGDMPGLIGSLITFGPMARSVDDLFLTLPILAGPDQRSPYTLPVPISARPDLKKLRVAYFTENGFTPVDPEVQETVRKAAHSLKDKVALVAEDRPACVGQGFTLHWELFLGGDRGRSFKQALHQLGVNNPSWELKEFIRQSEQSDYSVADLRQRLIEIDRFRFEMLDFMKRYDLIIGPVFPKVAKPHGIGIKEISDFSYAMVHNLTGWPTAVVRCGASKKGLPIGVQIAARPWEDFTALSIAKELETLHGGWVSPRL